MEKLLELINKLIKDGSMFSQLISELEEAGLSHQSIGERVGTGKSNVSQIKTRGTVPNYFVGEKLLKLHLQCCPKSDLHTRKNK